jgi:Membrane MotB of proton-channel complex MotA/MotB
VAKSRKRALAAVNTEGWMMSYADMATILLAMFIVLSTLGKDQTGASLQKGLESWRETRHSLGLGNFLPTSSRANSFEHVGPKYNLDNGGNTGQGQGDTGDGKPGSRSIDQETEAFQRFLNELERQFKVNRLPDVVGQASVDLFEPFNQEKPYWTSRQKELLTQIIPLLRRSDYRVVFVVWAPMAKESALMRSAEKAKQLADELAIMAQLETKSRDRLVSVAKTWPYVEFQRPVASLVVVRTAATGR